MKIQLMWIICLLLVTSCGAGGGKGSGASSKTQARSEADPACKVTINKLDSPSMIAKKAYRMEVDCKLKTEESLIKKLGSV